MKLPDTTRMKLIINERPDNWPELNWRKTPVCVWSTPQCRWCHSHFLFVVIYLQNVTSVCCNVNRPTAPRSLVGLASWHQKVLAPLIDPISRGGGGGRNAAVLHTDSQTLFRFFYWVSVWLLTCFIITRIFNWWFWKKQSSSVQVCPPHLTPPDLWGQRSQDGVGQGVHQERSSLTQNQRVFFSYNDNNIDDDVQLKL